VYYLKLVIGANISPHFISLEDVDSIKKSGGLNNDWDLTYTILNTILSSYFDPYNRHISEHIIRGCGEKNDHEVLNRTRSTLRNCNRQVLQNQLPRQNISKLYFNTKNKLAKNSPFLLNCGDVKSGNLAKRIFQEVYLGEGLFTEIYSEAPLFYRGGGYINREKLIPAREQLEYLTGKSTVSIATGRPEVEADYALRKFSIYGMFRAVVTEDQIVEAEKIHQSSLRKPHPYILERCREESGYSREDRVYYVGDMPDDMMAAAGAGVVPLGFVNEKTDVRSEEMDRYIRLLKKMGAYKVCTDFLQVLQII
ncbi:MAG: HAD family hydrolase, partial [Spirochaetota bacterium]